MRWSAPRRPSARGPGRSRSAAASHAATAAHARAESAMKARPGGSMRPFCDPVTSDVDAEAVHRQVDRAPTAVMPSTTRSTSRARVISAIAGTGCSDARGRLARLHVDGARLRMRLERRGDGLGPHRASPLDGDLVGHQSERLRDLPQRSPNLPPLTKITSSPGEHRLVIALSMAPVPDAARMSTSSLVPKSSRSPSWTSSSTAANCGVRWWMSGQRHRCQHLGRDRRGSGGEKVRLDHGSMRPRWSSPEARAQAYGPPVAQHSPVVDSTRTPVVRRVEALCSRPLRALSRQARGLVRAGRARPGSCTLGVQCRRTHAAPPRLHHSGSC